MKELEKKAAIYVRASSTIEIVEKQLEELLVFAESQGYRVTNTYVETKSGVAHICGRSIQSMLEGAEQRKFEAVILSDMSRIGRKSKDVLSVLEKLEELDIELISLSGPTPLHDLEPVS